MIVRDFVNPNGLCFSPDEKILYVNDSNRHRKLIRAYDVEGNGMLDLGSERLFCDMRATTDQAARRHEDATSRVTCTARDRAASG